MLPSEEREPMEACSFFLREITWKINEIIFPLIVFSSEQFWHQSSYPLDDEGFQVGLCLGCALMNNCFPLWNVRGADILLTLWKRKKKKKNPSCQCSLSLSLSVLVRSGTDKSGASGNWTGRIEGPASEPLPLHTCPPPLHRQTKQAEPATSSSLKNISSY